MSIEKKSGVYKITNVLNGNVYVGSAVFFKRRWSLHKSELRKNHHHSPKLQNAWNKYGEDNFEFSVIEELPPVKDVLLEREQFWMDYYEAYNTHNYNVAVTAGSPMTGRKHTPERNAKMSIIMKVELPRPKGRGFLLHRGQFHSQVLRPMSQSFPLHGLSPRSPRLTHSGLR